MYRNLGSVETLRMNHRGQKEGVFSSPGSKPSHEIRILCKLGQRAPVMASICCCGFRTSVKLILDFPRF
jgi:hypothetical protein